MRAAVKGASKFVTAPAWSGYVLGKSGPFADATTDAKLDSYIAANSGTLFHPVGTASMSPRGARNGVTDPDLKVKKVSGLRVVDLSVLVRVIFVPSTFNPLNLILSLAVCSRRTHPSCRIRCRRKSLGSYQSVLHILILNSQITPPQLLGPRRTTNYHNHSVIITSFLDITTMLIYIIY